eukprot:NODE_167_length_14562_cov_0.357256.p7 type:complete len:296 gc:universal NODE_167_length_14562_cov_0.357256:4261-5148(+)
MYFTITFGFNFKNHGQLMTSFRSTVLYSGMCELDDHQRMSCVKKQSEWTYEDVEQYEAKKDANVYLLKYGAAISEYENAINLMKWNLPNIIKFYEVTQTQFSVTRYMEQCIGSVRQQHLQSNLPVNTAVVKHISRDILSAILQLHNKGYFHLDIKPDNMVECVQDDTVVYKLIDFEYMTSATQVKSRSGTPEYAPEKVSYDIFYRIEESIDTAKWDIASFSKSIYELIYRIPCENLQSLCYSEAESRLAQFKKIEWFQSDEIYYDFIELMRNTMYCNLKLIQSANDLITLNWFTR